MSKNGRRRWRKWLARERKRGNDPAASWGLCKEKTGLARKAQGKSWAGADLPKLRAVPLPSPPWSPRSLVGMSERTKKRRAYFGLISPHEEVKKLARAHYYIGERLRLCPGCFQCREDFQGYGFFLGGDPRDFTPDEECSTEAERALHRQHCEAWERGERPAVKVSGIEWTEAMTRTGRDGKAKTIPAGFKLVERTTYGLGTTRATNDKYGRFYLPEFHHKASGFMVWWHKWIGRSMKTAGSVANIANMIDECIASLPPLPKPGRGHLPRARVGACWVCGLKLCCGGWQYALISDEEFHEHAVHQVCIGEYPVIAESVGRAPKAAKKAQGDGR